MVQTLKTWWTRLARTAFGRWFFSRIMGFLIPYTGSVRPLILAVEPGFAQVCIRDRRGVRNHLKSIHAIAIANLGEVTTGLALHFTLPNEARAILTNLSVTYLKKARGTITATTQFSEQVSVGPMPIEARLVDEQGDVVATVNAIWLVDVYRRNLAKT